MALLKKPDAVLFDWDGTLVDTLDSLLTGYNDVLRHFGRPQWNRGEAKENIRISARERFPQMFGERSDEAMRVYYASIEKNHLELLSAMTGAEDFLQKMKQQGIAMGVISNKRDSILKKEITYLGWGNYFSGIVGAGRAERDKPAPDALRYVLDEMHKSADNTLWYIGDTTTDLEFAHNTGCKKIFISHGFGAAEDARKYDPDMIAGDFGELWKGLEPLFNLR